MRERRVRVIPVKRNEPDVDQFVLALLAMLADRRPDEPGGAPEPPEEQLAQVPDEQAEYGDAAV